MAAPSQRLLASTRPKEPRNDRPRPPPRHSRHHRAPSAWRRSTVRRPLDGDVLLAFAGGEVRAALDVESGRAVADPFWPSAELVDLLRAAAGDRPRRRTLRRMVRPALA